MHAEVTGTEAPSSTPACAEGGRKDREFVKQQWAQPWVRERRMLLFTALLLLRFEFSLGLK